MSRPETGPMQFGDDWPGVFIRGDNAFHFAMELRAAMDALKESDYPPFRLAVLAGLAGTLECSNVQGGHKADDLQLLRPFEEAQTDEGA